MVKLNLRNNPYSAQKPVQPDLEISSNYTENDKVYKVQYKTLFFETTIFKTGYASRTDLKNLGISEKKINKLNDSDDVTQLVEKTLKKKKSIIYRVMTAISNCFNFIKPWDSPDIQNSDIQNSDIQNSDTQNSDIQNSDIDSDNQNLEKLYSIIDKEKLEEALTHAKDKKKVRRTIKHIANNINKITPKIIRDNIRDKNIYDYQICALTEKIIIDIDDNDSLEINLKRPD